MTLCIAVIGTSDQSCWLAEACKILLLLSSKHQDHVQSTYTCRRTVYCAVQHVETNSCQLRTSIIHCVLQGCVHNLGFLTP